MPGLPIVNTHLLAADVDEHALEHLVEIERLAGRVLEVPRELAGRRDSSASVELGVERRCRSRSVPRLAGIHGLACAMPQ